MAMSMQKCPLRLARLPQKFINAPKTHARWLSLYEHQSSKMLQQVGVPVPLTKLVSTASQAEEAAGQYGFNCTIKANIPRSGICNRAFPVNGPQQAASMAREMLSQSVTQLVVAQKISYSAQWYLAMTIDRENCSPAIIISKAGGRSLDAIARDNPESLHWFRLGFSQGITPAVFNDISARLDLSAAQRASMHSILQELYKIFRGKEATHLEIASLALTAKDPFICLDTYFTFDNAAAYRQPILFSQRNTQHEDPAEVEAEKHGLVYVGMDGGTVGTVVNGAGLAMATADAIGFCGGASTNFLDAGGKATTETMQQAFGIVSRDPRVAAILVNVYGGITRCDMIARSIIGAKQSLNIKLPMVVRLQGTNSEEGLNMLKSVNEGLFVESDFGRAAQLAVQLAAGRAT